MTYAFYAKRIALTYLTKFQSQLEKFERTQDAEDLHQARVAGRRLRNVLWIFKKLFPKEERKEWTKSIRPLARELGNLRDLDVRIAFIATLTGKTKDHSLQIQLKIINSVLKLKRENSLPKVHKTIKFFSKERILHRVKRVLREFPGKSGLEAQERLYKFSRKKILQRLKEFLDYEPYIHRPRYFKELHQMRIAAKKLRYTLECLDPIYEGRLKKFATHAQAFQDALGRFHDFNLWGKTTAQEFGPKKREFEKAVVYFLEICKDEHQRAFGEVGNLWKHSVESKTWNSLAKEVLQQ